MTTHEPATRELVVRGVEDNRRPARGLSRLLVLALGVFGLVLLVPSAVSLIRDPLRAPVLGSLNVVASLLYLLLAVCVAHNGRRMRIIGWMTLATLLTGALLFGLLTWTDTAIELSASVWADGGSKHFYLPLLLPLVAGVWMWFSDPRRIVVTAERMEGLGQSISGRRAERPRPGRRPGE